MDYFLKIFIKTSYGHKKNPVFVFIAAKEYLCMVTDKHKTKSNSLSSDNALHKYHKARYTIRHIQGIVHDVHCVHYTFGILVRIR